MKARSSGSSASTAAQGSPGSSVDESRYFAALGLISYKELEQRKRLREKEAAAKRSIEEQLSSTEQLITPSTERMRTRQNGVRKAANSARDATWKRSEQSPASSDAGRKSESPLGTAGAKS